MIDWIKVVAGFAFDNWQVVSLAGLAVVGLAIFGVAFKNVQAQLAAAMIALCIGFAGHFYRQGAEHVLEQERQAHAASKRAMAKQKEIDDVEIAKLRERVGNAPTATGIAIKADRAKRIGEIR